MPLPDKRLDRGRVEFERSLTPGDVERLVLNQDIQVIQCSSPVEPETWDLLNRVLFEQRPDIELRVYGFYSLICDLSFLDRMKNVRRLSVDCLREATGIERVVALEKLEKLAVGIYSLKSFDFLKEIPDQIKSLSLEATISKKPRLEILSRFKSLGRLYLESQQQGIEVLSELTRLEDLTLGSISTSNLDYISRLPQLWSLAIDLGGIRNFSAITAKESIEYLELWEVRGLADLSVISTLSGLQFLFLHSLRNVRSIPDLSKLSKLRRLCLENMKGLEDVSAICRAPALEEFIHISAQNVPPEKYGDLMGMPSLKRPLVGFGSRRKNEEFENLTRRSGKSRYSPRQFVFQ